MLSLRFNDLSTSLILCERSYVVIASELTDAIKASNFSSAFNGFTIEKRQEKLTIISAVTLNIIFHNFFK